MKLKIGVTETVTPIYASPADEVSTQAVGACGENRGHFLPNSPGAANPARRLLVSQPSKQQASPNPTAPRRGESWRGRTFRQYLTGRQKAR